MAGPAGSRTSEAITRANQTLTANADVSLDFGDGSRVNISKGSSFKLDGCSQFKAPNLEAEFRFTLLLGRIWSKVTHVFGAERERVSTCTERAACVASARAGQSSGSRTTTRVPRYCT